MAKIPQLVEGQDFTRDENGRWVFTREFLLAQGKCCQADCRNCPYGDPALPGKPPDCTCEYPRVVCRNVCGHPPDCGYYARWKKDWDRATARETDL